MMQQGIVPLPLQAGWERYQGLLVGAVAPLSAADLALRAAPSLWPVGRLAAHIVATRVGWFQGWMGEGDPALAALDPWDAEGAPPRTAAELVDGLEATWRMMRDCLERWTPEMLDDPFTRERPRGIVTRTRGWIIWHVIEHDLHHGGELALTLGMHGLVAPDL